MPTPEEEFEAFRQQEHASFDSFRSEIGKDFEGFRKEAHKDAEAKDTRIAETKKALAEYAEKVRDSTNWVQAEQVVEAQPAFKALETGSAGPAVKAEQVVENKDTRIAEAKEALAKYAEKVRNSTNWVQAEQVVEAQPAFKALETGSAGPAVKAEQVVEAQPAFKAVETGSVGPAVKAEQVVEAQPAVKAVETGSAGPAVKSEVVQAMVLRKMLGR